MADIYRLSRWCRPYGARYLYFDFAYPAFSPSARDSRLGSCWANSYRAYGAGLSKQCGSLFILNFDLSLLNQTHCGDGLGVAVADGVALGVAVAFGVAVGEGTATLGVGEASGVTAETGVGVAAARAGVGLGCMFTVLLSANLPSGPNRT